MKIKSINKEELELMPFDDIAFIILKEKGKKMKTTDLFKTICDSLGLTEKEYEEQIADFFTLLATEKRFIQLDKGYWDLKENHTAKIVIDGEEDEITEEDITIEEDTSDDTDEDEEEDDYYDSTIDDEDEDSEDDLKDLVLLEDEEAEESEI